MLHALLSLPLRLELAASAGVSASSPLPGTSPLFAVAGVGAGARGSAAAAAALADDDDDDFGPLTQQPAGERSAGSAGGAGSSPASQLCGRLVRCLLAACDGAGDRGKGQAAGAGAAAAPGRSVRASLKFGQLVVTLLQRYAGKHASHVRGDLTRLVERLESFMQKAARAALAAIEA